MSLAKVIIYGSLEQLTASLQQNPSLDEIDEYGYSPIVQTAIVNDPMKTRVLLDAGAKVDFADLTGRTALYWAADNGNLALCQLLLEAGANPNAYSRSGQPLLVMPVLKQHHAVKELLYRYGAELRFAQDFINAKTLGHRFELQGRVDIVDTQNTFIEVELEGFYPEFSLAAVRNSLFDFQRNFGGKHLRFLFPQVHRALAILERSSQLLSYQSYLTDMTQYATEIDALLSQEPLLLPVAYDGHAVYFVKYKNWLIRCDRGEFGRKNGTMVIYDIQYSYGFSRDLCKRLLYKRQFKDYIEEGVEQDLQLKKIGNLALPPQIVGNCTWANVEAASLALLFVLSMAEFEEDSEVDSEKIFEEVFHFYDAWQEWDKDRALGFCLDSVSDADSARKASKIALLVAILFQSCDFKLERDRERVARIIPWMMKPEYLYILRSYVKVFSIPPHPLFDNLREFMEDSGVDLDKAV